MLMADLPEYLPRSPAVQRQVAQGIRAGTRRQSQGQAPDARHQASGETPAGRPGTPPGAWCLAPGAFYVASFVTFVVAVRYPVFGFRGAAWTPAFAGVTVRRARSCLLRHSRGGPVFTVGEYATGRRDSISPADRECVRGFCFETLVSTRTEGGNPPAFAIRVCGNGRAGRVQPR